MSGGFCPGGFCLGGFCPRTDLDSSSTSSASTQDNSNNVNSDDAFLEIQRDTITVGKIYNDYSALARADFISSLSECCNCYVLCYIHDMMVSIVKRKTKQSIGPVAGRREVLLT